MARVKRGTISNKRRKNVLAQTKGYRHGLSTKERQAKQAIMHAGANAFAHRRDRKNDFRRLWIARLNGALRPALSYSRFINLLKEKQVGLDRKVLATLAKDRPETFERIVEKVQ